ncbi:CopD family protein [Sphingomonas sp. SM33]|uniref:Protoporphyrinogen IX oxidase n=1 Tax=Sphingomonas telluris TaxID=2907998 RepID=A0ABS9VPE9_9SPHN|nr:CopD family protein [Sphingomonas telluris]MCH8616859.1 CopD family protein [Sphingomonas telluris]
MSQFAGFLGAAYPWVKAAHVTFVIFWVAGLFILPRFYVYHHETSPGSAEDRAWTEREDRVRTIILTPSMIIVWVLGLLLAFHLAAFGQHWLSAKLLFVVGLTGYQGWLGSYGRRLAAGHRPLDNKTLRIMNELPGVAAAIIVVLVIVKPF